MGNLTWYYYRFTKMSFKELGNRIRILYINKKLKKDIKSKRRIVKDVYLKNDFNFKLYPMQIEDSVIEYANRYLNNEYLIFNEYLKLNLDKEKKYLYDPLNNKYSEKDFFENIRFKDIDPKPIWEINKQYQLVTLSIAYSKTNDNKYLDKLKKEIFSWIDQNSSYYTINWCSNLEMSIRNINWIFSISLIVERLDGFERRRIVNAIYKQAKFIFERLSLYSSANNHLIGELTFILLASLIIDCSESSVWHSKSKELLEKQIVNQFYEDGVNKEQSINYQLHTMEFYLLSMIFLRMNGEKFSDKLEEIVSESLMYIYDISEKNGEVFNIGDQDSGNIIKFDCNANDVLDILHIGSMYFNDNKYIEGKEKYLSGKAVLLFGDEYITYYSKINWQFELDEFQKNYSHGGVIIKEKKVNDRKVKVYFDYGSIGMAPLFAHAHSDILSFNLSVDGEIIFNDMGTYKYKTDDNWRDYFRGVYAHNTICINEKNQFNFLGPFICDKSPESKLIENGEKSFEACTNAYRREGCNISRKIIFKDDKILIVDKVISLKNINRKVESIFNLNSDIAVQRVSNNKYILEGAKVKLSLSVENRAKLNEFNGYREEKIRGYQSIKFNQIQMTNQIIAEYYSSENMEIVYEIEVI